MGNIHSPYDNESFESSQVKIFSEDGYTFNNVMDFANSNPVSSGFLGALLAGFVAGYLVLLLKKIFSKLPASLEGIKPVLLYPVRYRLPNLSKPMLAYKKLH